MRQSWFSRAQNNPAGSAGRRRARRTRRINLTVAVGLALLLGACDAQGGTTAVLAAPRPIAAEADHKAKAAPKQRWGGAAGLDPVVDGARNTTKPPSLRSQYPVVKTAQLPANRAEIVPAPAAKRTGFDARTSREIPSARQARQRTFANADGTRTTQYSATAVNYRKPDGTWAPIDSRLTADPAGGWRRGSDSVDLRLAARADAGELVRATLPGGGVLAYGAAGARPVTASVSGDTALYAGAWSDVDLELQAQAGGVKETLILRSAGAPRTYVFPLKLTGLTATMDGGAVALTDAAGVRQATIPAGYLADAAGEVSHGVTYRLVTSGGATALEVRLDDKWLTDAKRVFPVRADPPVVANGAATESLVVTRDNGESSARSGSEDLRVGRKGDASSMSYLKFPRIENDLRNHTIYGAQLQVVNFSAASCKPRQVTVHPVTQSWSGSDTGWSYPGPDVGGALSSMSFAQGYVGLGQSASSCPVTGSVFDLGVKGRNMVQGWVDGKGNNGLSLRATTADDGAWKVFSGTGTANPPTLYVTHSPYNAKYVIANPVPNPAVLQNQAGKVKVTITNKSAEEWRTGTYNFIYRAYNAKTNARIGQYVAASLPGTVARGASVTVDATIRAMPIGQYILDFSMAKIGGPVFTDEMVAPARISLRVDNIAPDVTDMYPPNGYQAPTLTPQLWAKGVDLDAPPAQTLQYKFEYCPVDGAGQPTGCTQSAYQANQAFTIPAGKLKWSNTYVWRAFVKDNTTETPTGYLTMMTAVPQPEITSRIANAPYGSQDRDFDQNIGNFSTGAVDAAVNNVGPPLKVTRTYNSLDPRRNLMFGAGWMTQFDMKLTLDLDGSGNAVVTYPDGQQVRFGKNSDGTFAAPLGRTASLALSGSSYVLKDKDATTYTFNGGPSGRIEQIADKWGRNLTFGYDLQTGRLAKVQARTRTTGTIGRSLTFGWTGGHVTSVSTEVVNGSALTWTYAYQGDLLTTVCPPGATACTNYSYSAGSHYRSGVLDSAPDSYWRLGETGTATAAGSDMANNLGKDAGVLRNVTLGEPGALVGTDNKAALFNNAGAVLELPKGIVKRSRDTAVELWFKVTTTQTGGPLIGYQDKAVDAAAGTGVPLLYVGTDGRLRGQFKTTAATPKPIEIQTEVRDGKWHHAVLSVSADVQTLYLDGTKKVSKPVSEGVLDHSLLTFNQAGVAHATNPTAWPGWGSTAKRVFNGSLDEIAVYGHALSEQAVSAHYALGAAQADQLSVVTMPSGKVASETVYDTDTDRVKEYTDGNGGTWKIGTPLVYGGDNDLRRSVQVLDPADRAYLYEYDALAGRMLRSGSPIGITARPEDRPPTPAPSPSPSPSQVCNSPDPGEPRFCTTIPGDAGGPVFEERELTGMVIRSFFYNAQGQQERIVSENGSEVFLTYDARGNVTSRKTCRAVGDCQTSYTSFTTPNASNEFDPKNDLPITTRDGRSTSATDSRYVESTTYTNAGAVDTVSGADSYSTKNTYTSGTELAEGSTTAQVPAGLPRTVIDSAGKTTSYYYNQWGDLARVVTPTGLRTEYTYDVLGRRIQDKDISDSYPQGVLTTYTYDQLNRPVTTTGPETTNAVDGTLHQGISTTFYDVDSNVIRVEARDLKDDTEPVQVTTKEYDEFNRVIRTVNAEGDEQTEGWDRFGNRVTVVDGNGNHYQYAYTARNDLAEVRLYDWNGDPEQDDDAEYTVLNSYAYDYSGRVAATLDSMGRRIEFTYLGDDLLHRKILKDFHNADGTKRDYVLEDNTYDGAGNLTRKVESNGLETTANTIDAMGRILVATVDPGGLNRSTTYTYDSLGNVKKTVQTGNASNVPFPIEAGRTNTVENIYNDKGQLEQAKVIDGSSSRITSYVYDQRGLTLQTTDPRGNVAGADKAAYTTTYKYDENGNQTQVIAPKVAVETDGGAAQQLQPVVTTGYDAFGRVVATRDALGNVARTEYDRLGRVVKKTGPQYTAPGGPNTAAAPVTSIKYDALNNPVETTDARGNVTKLTYDRLNRVVVKDEPGSTDDERAVWRYTYTRTGMILSTTSPTGVRTESTYDDLDRMVTSTAFDRKPFADSFTTTYKYDDAGNMLSTVSPGNAQTINTYNKVGELLTSTDPGKVVTRQGYDGFGNTIAVTDGKGRTIRTDYDGFGQVTRESDLNAAGAELRREDFQYDLAGNLTKRTDALTKTVTFDYDALNRMTRQIEPTSATESITTTFGYDAASNRTRYTDGRGNSTYYTVNSLGLPEKVIEPATTAHPAPADRTWTVSYDLNGNTEKLVAPGGVQRTRTYDAANRLIAENGSGAAVGAARGIGYDLDDRITSVTGGSAATTFTYNDRGGLLTATGSAGDSSFAFNDDGQVVSRTDAVGTAAFTYKNARMDTSKDAATGVVQTIAYDEAGQTKSIDYGSGRVRGYGYDDFGRVTSDVLKNSAGTEISKITYRYDLADHMIGKDTTGTAGAGANTFEYDDAGRMIAWTSSAGKVDYAWDDSGNRTRAGPKTATYDQRNRLLSDSDYTYAYTPRGTLATRTSSGLAEQYSFDAFDRLIGAEGQNYSYDALDRLISRGGTAFKYAGVEKDPVTDGAESFARGADGELLAVVEGTDKRLTISDEHADVVGSFAAGDPLTGLAGSTAFDPYGNRIATAGSQNNVGYQGDWTDPATGQVNMGARWYEPGTGAFTSRDTVNYSSGDSILANKYTYGAGNPMSNNDPTGNWPSCGWCKKAAGAVSSFVRDPIGTTVRATVAVGSWMVNQARAAVSTFVRIGINTLKSIGSGASRLWSATTKVWNKYVQPTLSSMKDRAIAKAREIHRQAVQIRAKASAAIQYVAKNTPIGRIAKAALPVIAGLSKFAMTAITKPSAITSSWVSVVQDVNAAKNQLYKEVTAAGGALVGGLKAAGDWVVDHKAEIAGFAAGALVGIGCGALIGVTGVGAVACGALGGAVDSLVKDAINGKSWDEMKSNALKGALIGGVLGPLSSIGGSAVGAGVRSLLGGGGRAALGAAGTAGLKGIKDVVGMKVSGVAGRAMAKSIGGKGASAGGYSVTKGAKEGIKNLVCGNSFAAGTRVVMADGSTKRIEDVQVGEKVRATDPTTGKTEARVVTDQIVGQGVKHLVALTVDTDGTRGSKVDTVTATEGHPIWVPNRKKWVKAGDLQAGSMLKTAAGTYVQVAAVRKWTAVERVFNLTVDGLHTYYVDGGNATFLVHNCSSRTLGRRLIRAGEAKPTGVNAQAHHIVPCGCPLARPAQDILKNHGIDINSVENGVWMSQKGHSGTFGSTGDKDYYSWINDEVADASAAGGKQGVLDFLAETKATLTAVDQDAWQAY